MKRHFSHPSTLLLSALLLCVSALVKAEELVLSRGQTLYLPIYSHVWHGDFEVEGRFPLKSQVSALVSIRNTSLVTPIKVLSARYYSTDGKLLKEYIPTPKSVTPMGTMELFVERKESEGGSGANFIIRWESGTPTNPPIVEAVHAELKSTHTLSFTTTAREINPEN
jgi:hypothetical protein